jgi:hypothetical protein
MGGSTKVYSGQVLDTFEKIETKKYIPENDK